MSADVLPPNITDDCRVVLPAAEYRRDRRRWLRARRTGLGASDIASILGVSPFKEATELAVYLDKTSLDDPSEDGATEQMRWGNRLENAVVQEFSVRHARELGVKVLPTPGLLTLASHPVLLCTPDRLLADRKTGRIIATLEVKTAGWRQRSKWDHEVPIGYQVQVQQQLAITGLLYGYLVVLHAGQEMPEPYLIERDEDAIPLIIERAEAWWERHIVRRVIPDATELDVSRMAAVYPGAPGEGPVVLPDHLVDRLRLRARIASRIKDLQAARDRIDVAIKQQMGNAASAVGPDGAEVVRWRRYPVNNFDVTRFRADHPDLAAAYSVPAVGQRFTPKITAEVE